MLLDGIYIMANELVLFSTQTHCPFLLSYDLERKKDKSFPTLSESFLAPHEPKLCICNEREICHSILGKFASKNLQDLPSICSCCKSSLYTQNMQ